MKPVKISLSSSNEELLSTMKEEGKRVEYWHKKYYGGPRKYDEWQTQQLAKVRDLPADSELIGDMVDYHSLTTGNRWKTFEVTTSYGKDNAYTRMFKFCYWDTYGSVGAFYNCTAADMKHRILLVFPSHFFLRYADRMGIQHRDAALVCEFFNRNHAFAVSVSKEFDEDGRQQFVIGAKEGACYGFARTKIDSSEDLCKCDNVLEVRTFLKYEQLTKRQREECDAVREMAEFGRLTDGAPVIHSIGRAMTDENYSKKITEGAASLIGLTTEQMEQVNQIMFSVMESCDFVSADMRTAFGSLANGEINEQSQQDSYRLMTIVRKRVKENTDFISKFSYVDLLHIAHEWKGDDYDWNKWFYRLCHELQPKVSSELQADFEALKQRCIAGEFTYETLCDFLHTKYS